MTWETTLTCDGLKLVAHVARPPATAAPRGGRPGLVICHGFPTLPSGARTVAQTFPSLADRVAAGEAGWTAMALAFRGTGGSEGEFSLGGWMRDLRAAIDHLLEVEHVDGVWLAGFATGGALAICAAGEDDRVRGVAAVSAPADFADWAAEPRRFVEECRRVGVLKHEPESPEAFVRELRELRPLALVGKIPPRPLLLLHGSGDVVVPVTDARVLADAAEGEAELRIVTSGGHGLRHDPRAVAILLGWLDRQVL